MRRNLGTVKGDIALDLNPSLSRHTDPQSTRIIRTVFTTRGDALRLPESSLSFPWADYPHPKRYNAKTTHHNDLMGACKESYRYVASLVDAQLWPPYGKLSLHLYPEDSMPSSRRLTVFSLCIMGEPIFFIDHHTPLSSLNDCWKTFPFMTDELCRAFSDMPVASQDILNQASAWVVYVSVTC